MSRVLSIACLVGLLALASCNSAPTEPDGAASTPSQSPTAEPEPALPAGLELLRERPVVRPPRSQRYVNPGAVVIDEDGTFHMFSNSFSAYPGKSRTDHLVSDDGVEWERPSPAPEFVNSDVPYLDDFTTAFVTTVYVADNGTWVGYFYTFTGLATRGVVGRVTAPGPEGPWRADPKPALVPGPKGAWDHVRLSQPSVVRDGDDLSLYYTGYDDSGVGRIGVATSKDGVSWKRADAPLFEGAAEWDEPGISDPQVIAIEDGLAMIYRANPATAAFGIGLATSDDGTNWHASDLNPVVDRDTVPDAPNSFWESEAATDADGNVWWWLEVGNHTTSVYGFRVAAELLR